MITTERIDFQKFRDIVNDLNNNLMNSEPFIFKLDGSSNSIHLEVRPNNWFSPKNNTRYIHPTIEAQNTVNRYIVEKYGFEPTWHHGYCFNFYENGKQHPYFLIKY